MNRTLVAAVGVGATSAVLAVALVAPTFIARGDAGERQIAMNGHLVTLTYDDSASSVSRMLYAVGEGERVVRSVTVADDQGNPSVIMSFTEPVAESVVLPLAEGYTTVTPVSPEQDAAGFAAAREAANAPGPTGEQLEQYERLRSWSWPTR